MLALTLQAGQAEEVNVYSGRKEALIKPLFDDFTEQTGIRVNLVTGKADALITRLELEGENSPADLLLTVDAGRLYRAKEQGLLQAITSTWNSTGQYRKTIATPRDTGTACPSGRG